MPPKVKITREEIIQTALALVREQGVEAVNARAVASTLGCSTQPVFSNFSTMEELQRATAEAAYGCYLDYIRREEASGEYPRYKAFGMAYIRFAGEERELFRLLFLRDRSGEDTSPSPDFEASVRMIMESCGVSFETATVIHLENWGFVHGIGTMLATSFLTLDRELISRMVSDVYQGIRQRYLQKEGAV